MAYIWDERYSNKEYAFGKDPNVFFKSVIKTMKPGKMLVPGAGEGRDAVFAASLGWQVDAFDLSAVGREKCLNLAREFKTTVNYRLLNATDFTADEGIYDAAALIYFHLPEAIRKQFYREVFKSVRKGGSVILELFNPKQLQNTSGGPKDVSMLMTPSILSCDFNGLQIIQNEEMEVTLHEGKYHEGKADIVRFIGIKK